MVFSIFDTPVTLKQDQDHQTWYELVDTKQGYDNAKNGKTLLKQCLGKKTAEVFNKSGNVSIITLEYV